LHLLKPIAYLHAKPGKFRNARKVFQKRYGISLGRHNSDNVLVIDI